MKNTRSGSQINAGIIDLEKRLDRISTQQTGSGVAEQRKLNGHKLENILDMGFKYHGVPTTPILRNYIGERNVDKLGIKPIPEEQRLFDEILGYLLDYYDVEPSETMLEDLKKSAEEDTLNLLKCEAYYEIHQLFSAFGHTSYEDIGKDRIKRLMIYKDRKRWFKPDPQSFTGSYNYYTTRGSHQIKLNSNMQASISEAFSKVGPKNSGDPEWMRDTSVVNGETVRNKVRKASEVLGSNMDKQEPYNVRDASGIISTYATLFGRNQTKGVEARFDKKTNKGILVEFSSAGRVIYGVDRLTNNIQSLLYYPIGQHLAKFPEFVGLQDDIALKNMLLGIYKMDVKYGVKHRKNMDVGKYDTGCSAKTMCAECLTDMDAFCSTQVHKKIAFIGLAVDTLKPIYYKSKEHGKVEVLYTYGGHKSGDYKTAGGGSRFNIKAATSVLIEIDRINGDNGYETRIIEYNKKGLSFILVLGDDLSVGFKNEVDAQRFRDLYYKRYGGEMNEAKDAPGSAFLQHFINSAYGISYALPRALRSALYPESTPQTPAYVFESGLWMLVELLKESPHLGFFIKFVAKYDNYKLGTYDYETNKPNTFKEFYVKYVTQAKDYATNKHVHGNSKYNMNDPRFKRIFNPDGTFKRTGMLEMGETITNVLG